MAVELAIAVAQINPTMGALDTNLDLLRAARARGAAEGADLVVTPEMGLLGYPPDDLVLKPALQARCAEMLGQLAAETADGGPAILVGAPWVDEGRLHNAALLLGQGAILAWRAKHELPSYGVFDDKRIFTPGLVPGPMPLPLRSGRTVRLGVMICEDMWFPDVSEALAESGAELLVCLNASPYEHGKQDVRLQQVVARVTETGLPMLVAFLVGGQDELVFDGMSFALDAGRRLVAQAPAFEEAFLMTRWVEDGGPWRCASAPMVPPPEPLESIYRAMMLGLRDYVSKNRFPGVVLGLSGGIDSALSAAVAADALGPDRVRAVMMPSRYTSAESLEDAAACAAALGIALDEIAIEPAARTFRDLLHPLFADRPADITEENVQSRVRGLLLMAISNKLGPMVLTTGNKSEMSVGYATLYGDMCGGFSVLKDVYKTTVFELARWRNQGRPSGALGPEGAVMPERVISKPPSAELRFDQKDEDSLPPYPVLDAVLEGLVEQDLSPRELVARGFAPDVVRRVSNLLDLAEYKRRQAPPGVKLTRKAFGRDRRYPITNAFRTLGLRDLDRTR